MPNYEIEHAIPISPGQQDELAEAITKIHCETFDSLRIFVNIRFTDISGHPVYIAGKRRATNRIFATVRGGPARSRADYDKMSNAVMKAWNEIVNIDVKKPYPSSNAPRDLHAIFVIGGITAGMEAGFILPEAGADGKWVKENFEEFQKRAEGEDGDPEMKELVKECKDRGLV